MVTSYYIKSISPSGNYLLQTEDGFEDVVILSDIYRGLRIVKSINSNEPWPWIVPWFIRDTYISGRPCRYKSLSAAKAAITRYIQKRGEPCR